MPRTPTTADALLTHALTVARLAEEQDALPFRLEIKRGALIVTVCVTDAEDAAPAPPGLPPIQRRVLSVLNGEYQSAKSVARRAGRAAGYVRAALAALVDKNLAEYRPRRGYRVRPVQAGS